MYICRNFYKPRLLADIRGDLDLGSHSQVNIVNDDDE